MDEKNSKKADIDQPIAFKQVVSEGSIVLLDGRDLISGSTIATDSIERCSWKQTAGTHVNTTEDTENNFILSFTAPFVKGSDINTTLSFELSIIDRGGKAINPHYKVDVVVKRVQRAIIFQGGVALGAYEAGVYQAIVEKLTKNNEDKKRKGLDNEKRPLFDIIAGTSIGAMNGAIVVSSVTEDEDRSLEDPANWKDSSEKVVQFWRAQQQLPTIADILDMNPFYHYWWDIIHNTSKVFKHSITELMEFYANTDSSVKKWYDVFAEWAAVHPSFFKDLILDGWYIPATAEAARRYYSSKQFLRTWGSFNVASGIYPLLAFGKFFDPLEHSNLFPARPDNKHYLFFSLKRTLERFVHFPIKTSHEEKQPRFLLVTVDVRTGDAVTFDSYSKETKYHDEKNIIFNPMGIEIEHALATGTFPDFFNYPKFKVNDSELNIKNEHIFWDGGFRSNTPLREVLQAHRDYWLSIAREEHKDEQDYEYENDVPDLEIYIADLWPSDLKEDPVSFDRDFVENRKWDLIFGDKTDYDEQVATVVTDYVDLTRLLKNLAEQKDASKDEINHILNSYASSRNTKGKTRKYKELLEGRFRLTKVVRIDRKDDGNEIHEKVFDYSYKTIERLIEDGYRDASIQIGVQTMKDEFLKLERRLNKRINDNLYHKHQTDKRDKYVETLERLQQGLQRIQESLEIANGHDITRTTILIGAFIDDINTVPDEHKENNKLLKEEKTSVIDAAKLLQQIINK